jgi:hypothetical protein
MGGLIGGSLLCLLIASCTKTEKPAEVQTAAVATPAATNQPVPAPAPGVPVAKVSTDIRTVPFQADQAAMSWASIKDYTYDQRSSFVSGASILEATLAGQVGELNSKRAALPSTVDTKDWDFAMSNLVDAQSYFKATVDEAAHTTPEFWNQEKDKVDAAWQKAEDAFDKVRTATTF